ncbi:cytochrome c3 family protein [Cytobacillus dafuensis]|uniref:Nitrate reductase n=1 Tax=Cytobacillus dafuensis TaxID=1742359 RepID=A0A5B8Z7S9_CYTDA|nr:NapC/NirT family cytochrome c [Cytobacillus dafuensis]QED49024.1 nitrate reductase [Cytobacillus dafuensis]
MLKKLLAIDKKLLIMIGVFVGIIVSVVTVKTFAYTDSADFCQSCHIMTNVYESHGDSTHAKLACSDCHLPHETLAGKLVFKAKSGIGHVYYNTLGSEKIPEVLLTTEDSKKAVNQNCINCHESTLDNVSHDAKDSCSSCHQAIPHGKGFKTEDFYKPPKSGELLDTKGGTMNNG